MEMKDREVENNEVQMSRIMGETEDLPSHCGPFVSHLNNNLKAAQSHDQLLK